ncbi:MAG: acyl-CoA dehydrogenase family protein [Actinomycetia bacterium]|nr:acyl-CoA dehydrogenase family protein [Actinomycetes bacterium]
MALIELEPVAEPASVRALREEVRAWLAAERRQGTFEPTCDSWLAGFSPAFSRKLAARGWVGMMLPPEYGGHGRSGLERFAVTAELLAAGAPVAAHWVADRQMAPMILRYGTEAQKRRFLPPIARGEEYWAIGMSEPGAGSDLAAVRTRLEPADGGWRLTGQKLWSSGAHGCHYMMVLCRSGPPEPDRHAGLTNVVVDLRAPGVTIRPIRLLNGEHHFNEVTFDGVFVPDDHVIGSPGDGWAQVTAELAFERSGPERILSTYPLLAEMVRAAAARPDDDRLATLVGGLAADLWALLRMSRAIAGMLDRGRDPEVEAALVKDLGTRFEQRVAEAGRAVHPGPVRLPAADPLGQRLAEAILHAPGFTIRGGTNEILRGIVARGLGLR